MEDKFVVKRLRLTPESIAYIDEYAEQHNIPDLFKNRVINSIIEEHKKIKTSEQKQKAMIEEISQNIAKEVQKEFKRVLLGTNNADRNTQILIELMNGLFLNQNITGLLSTEDLESEPVKVAKEVVQERIKNLQQRKADALKGGESNGEGLA